MEYIEFGKIVNTHALKGDVKIYSYTDNEDNILNLKTVYINNVKYIVSSCRYLKGMFTMHLKGIETIEEAETLVGNVIMREVTHEERKVPDEFFVKDLIGIEVYHEDGTQLGILTEVISTGANDVYEVKRQDNTLVYLPAIKRVIKKIDIEARNMIVGNLEGLI